MPLPLLELYNHQEDQAAALGLWQTQAEKALPQVLTNAKSADAPLHQMESIEISFVSDEAITQVHGDFMDDPTATDVITFHHGEIIISLDTAKRQAADHDEPYEREVTRYIVHGLLHLAGWDDLEEAERRQMHEIQEGIVAKVISY